jgi:hypothetical protein
MEQIELNRNTELPTLYSNKNQHQELNRIKMKQTELNKIEQINLILKPKLGLKRCYVIVMLSLFFFLSFGFCNIVTIFFYRLVFATSRNPWLATDLSFFNLLF